MNLFGCAFVCLFVCAFDCVDIIANGFARDSLFCEFVCCRVFRVVCFYPFVNFIVDMLVLVLAFAGRLCHDFFFFKGDARTHVLAENDLTKKRQKHCKAKTNNTGNKENKNKINSERSV